jgi:hypothetical protein
LKKYHKEKYGNFSGKIKEARLTMPWLTYDVVRGKAKRLKKKIKSNPSVLNQVVIDSSNRGRPKGATKQSKKEIEEKKVQAKVILTNRVRSALDDAKIAGKERLAKGTYEIFMARFSWE